MATGDPVSVKENEYAIIETAYQKGWVQPCPPPARTGKSVAVVGSGPAGLAAADLLNKRGHSVTVYERDDRVGGLLMYGIPNMKLEKQVIDRRADILKAEGIRFVTGCDVGRDIPARQLADQYDALVLACGAKEARDLPVEGRDAQGIYFAVDFLSAVTKSLLDSDFADGACPTAQGKDVLIIGGGDTGNDCVGTSIRQGCASVTQLEMMPCPPTERAENNQWPEWPRVLKVDYGQEESIAVFGKDPREYQTTVKSFYKDEKGQVSGARIARLAPQKDEATGRTLMVPTGEEYDLPCQLVLIAAGFTGCEEYLPQDLGLERTTRGTLADRDYATALPKVFTCGDMRRGQSLVVWALREGTEAAAAVDRYLMGYTNL